MNEIFLTIHQIAVVFFVGAFFGTLLTYFDIFNAQDKFDHYSSRKESKLLKKILRMKKELKQK